MTIIKLGFTEKILQIRIIERVEQKPDAHKRNIGKARNNGKRFDRT